MIKHDIGVAQSPAFNFHDAIRELVERRYDNHIDGFDWTLSGRVKVLFTDFCKTKPQKEKFLQTFLPAMQARLKEINSLAAKKKFIAALCEEFDPYDEFFSALDILKRTVTE